MALSRLLVLIVSVCLADSVDLGMKKLATMQKLKDATSDGIIEFTAD